MDSYLLRGALDIQMIHEFTKRLSERSTIVDLDEALQLDSVRANTRLWSEKGILIAFAFVDDYHNLRFEIDPQHRSAQLNKEIIAWGVACVRKRNIEAGVQSTLDASFSVEQSWQISLLEQFGFVPADFRTLQFERSLRTPLLAPIFPSGFLLRCTAGEHEVDQLVALHRAAFGTDNMTVAQRLAIMHGAQYERELDLVVVAPNGELAAFCICGLAELAESEISGFTDPLGTHPQYQQRGLGKAIIMAGLHRLKKRGATKATLRTSSTNLPMQGLAAALGFICVAERLWFSKEIS